MNSIHHNIEDALNDDHECSICTANLNQMFDDSVAEIGENVSYSDADIDLVAANIAAFLTAEGVYKTEVVIYNNACNQYDAEYGKAVAATSALEAAYRDACNRFDDATDLFEQVKSDLLESQ